MTRTSACTGLLTRSLAAIIAAGVFLSVLAPQTYAQDRGERRTLLQLLFGKKPQRRSSIEEVITPRTNKRRVRRRQPAADAAAAVTGQPAVEKVENARKILVIGDFLAAGLGEGMKSAFETSAGVVIESRNNVASGLVREDYFNWQEQLPAYIDEIKPAVVVVMLGANDRQQMSINGSNEKFRTETWLNEYEARVARLAAAVTARNLPLLWVGLPAFQSASMTADAVQLNGLFRTQTEKAGGEFIDVWDGFVDENGKFIVTGSDVNGQQVRLRGSDGLNLTRAGRRKLAFYLEKPARRLLGETTIAGFTGLDASSLPKLIDLPPAENHKVVRTQPISLVDPDLDGGKELLGAETVTAIITQSARNLLIDKGEIEQAPAGRIDDYRMTK